MLTKKTRLWRFIGLFIAISISPFELEVTSAKEKNKDLVQVTVYRLIMDPTNQNPVVLLSDPPEKQALPIWISFFEANAIYSELIGIKHHRPLTHDLLERIIQRVNGTIRQIIISHVKENIYYATIVMDKGDSIIEIDARPSDSIVLALKFKAPIFVNKNLFKNMAISLEEENEAIKQYGLTLQNLTSPLAQYFSFESTSGVLVSYVHKESKAEKDGLKIGDIIVEIEKETIKDIQIMKNMFDKNMSIAEAKIYRDSAFMFLTLHLK